MRPDLSATPVFSDLSPAERDNLAASARQRTFAAGDVLFYEGDATDSVYVLLSGRCALSWGQESRGEALPSQILDPLATLGGLPHTVKATALEACEVLCWNAAILWQSAAFGAAARRYLGTALMRSERRRGELAAPLHYAASHAQVASGVFRFDDVTLIFAFCEANPAVFGGHLLPGGLSILQRPGRATTPVLIALADFPVAYPEDHPDQRFAYTETTFFMPVRCKTAFGFYVPFIYPSAWEPILIGREVYGFPKQLGETIFAPNAVSLTVDDKPQISLTWDGGNSKSERRLIRALSDWLGIPGQVTAAAFQAGEALRKITRLPPYRRVDVYNHKKIPAANATTENPVWSVDQLTRATFGVLGWQQIIQLDQALLDVCGQIFAPADLTLRDAYRTRLNMRLSPGQVIEDYQNAP